MATEVFRKAANIDNDNNDNDSRHAKAVIVIVGNRNNGRNSNKSNGSIREVIVKVIVILFGKVIVFGKVVKVIVFGKAANGAAYLDKVRELGLAVEVERHQQ